MTVNKEVSGKMISVIFGGPGRTNTFAMSYMTEILNSISMKVSSGYEILSFRMN